ncbi:hypothetical protein D3C75_470720 [compost metagenome]
MKVKILFVLLSVSLVINVILFYGLTKYDLVEKGSARTSIDQSASLDSANPLGIPQREDTIEEENTYGSNTTSETVSGNLQAEQSGFGYIYSLTDDKILEAINDGKKNTGYFGEDFMLPLLTSTSNDSMFEYMDIFIDTPYRYVAIYSSNQYAKYDRTSSIEEVLKFISYDHLSLSAYLPKGSANLLATELTQEGEVIESYKTDNNEDGDIKSIYFSLDAIDFREPAILKIFEKNAPENYSEYKISFEDYVK